MDLKFSIIIPVYNSKKYLEVCLNSIRAQTYKSCEVIVIDDCSTDNSSVIIEKYSGYFEQFMYLKNEVNRGVSYSRNKGIQVSKGEYICFIDSDDEWHPKKLEIIDEVISKYDQPVLIAHDYNESNTINRDKVIDSNNIQIRKLSPNSFYLGNILQTSCVTVKRDINPLFDQNMSFCEDFELFFRIVRKHQSSIYLNLDLTYLSRPQLSKGGLSGNRLRMRFGEMEVFRRFLKEEKLIVLYPLVIVFSMLKYFLKMFRF